jgi:uncharacterized protein (TIGR02271 family)
MTQFSEMVDARVVDAAGHEAFIADVQPAEGGAQAWLQLADGMRVKLPVALLMPQRDGSYSLPFDIETSDNAGVQTQMSFPVMEEALHVEKRTVDTGKGIRIHKTVHEQEHVVDQPLRRDELQVEHVAVGRIVADADVPQARYEGDTFVIPVLEEVLVVQKQLLLKEEVRITRHAREVHAPQKVVLKSEHIDVQGFDEGSRP